MRILALDTCLNATSAAVLDGANVLAARSEPMARGHQERLATLVRKLMDEAGLGFGDLDRIGVTVGPGSFTGLRVGLAFAKGLASALDIPVVGVGTLEAMAAATPGLVAAAIDARRDQLYFQVFECGRPLMAPDALAVGTAVARLVELGGGRPVTLVGSGAALLDVAGSVLPTETPDPAVVARLAVAVARPIPPRPLYLRAPDAKLPI